MSFLIVFWMIWQDISHIFDFQGLAKVFVVDVIIGGDLASIFYRKIDGSIEKIPSFLDTTVDSTWFNQLAAWGLVRSDISQIAIGSSHRLYLFRSANKVYGEGSYFFSIFFILLHKNLKKNNN